MVTEVAIRSGLRPGDLGAIVKLHGEYYHRKNGFDCTFEPYVAIPLAELAMRNQPNECVWVVEKDGELKGCIAIANSGDGIAQLRWFLLDETLQGHGLGRTLMALALDFARKNAYSSIILWTVDMQDTAIFLYKKNGFALVEEKRHELWGQKLIEQCYRLDLTAPFRS